MLSFTTFSIVLVALCGANGASANPTQYKPHEIAYMNLANFLCDSSSSKEACLQCFYYTGDSVFGEPLQEYSTIKNKIKECAQTYASDMPESVKPCDNYALTESPINIDIKQSLGDDCFETMYEALTNDGLTLQGELTPVDYHNADLAFAVTSKACVALGYAQAKRGDSSACTDVKNTNALKNYLMLKQNNQEYTRTQS